MSDNHGLEFQTMLASIIIGQINLIVATQNEAALHPSEFTLINVNHAIDGLTKAGESVSELAKAGTINPDSTFISTIIAMSKMSDSLKNSPEEGK